MFLSRQVIRHLHHYDIDKFLSVDNLTLVIMA